jgi:trigger factor
VKVTASEIEGSQVVLDMEIEPERVDKAMERAYRRVATRVNVPGFRRGKAPRVMVERLVGREALMNEAIDILVPEVYQEAVRQTGIEPVDQPKLDIVSAEPLSVKATVPVRPRVELGDYRAIRQSQEVPEVTDEQVERALESIRQSRAQWVPVGREARAGDLVTIDIKGRVDDRSFVDRQAVQVVLDPERTIVAPGVVEQTIGMAVGDRKALDVTLPGDFPEKDLAGQEAVVEIGVTEIKEKQVPALDDELARSLGEYSDLEALRQEVRKELEEQAKAQARQNLEDSVLAAVIDQAKAEPPAPWVEEQAETLRKNTERGLTREGLTLDRFLGFSNRTQESFREELLTTARQQLKRALVLGAVADVEGITVGDEELNTALQQAIADRGGRVDPAERERLVANLRSLLRDRKTVARLVEIATGAEEAAKTAEAEPPAPAAAESQTEGES